MTKLDIYNPPQEPIPEHEYAIEKLTKKWRRNIDSYFSQVSTAASNVLKTASDGISQVPLPKLPAVIQNLPSDIKESLAADEPLFPNMLYVIASGSGAGIILKSSPLKKGIISRFMFPTTVATIALLSLYPKSCSNLVLKYTDSDFIREHF